MRLSLKERRIKLASANKFHRKSGVAQWRDLRFLSTAIYFSCLSDRMWICASKALAEQSGGCPQDRCLAMQIAGKLRAVEIKLKVVGLIGPLAYIANIAVGLQVTHQP